MLIVTSPKYMFWPPDLKTFLALVKKWTSSLPMGSPLTHIEICSGFGDEGERAREFEDEDDTENGSWREITDYGAKFSAGLKDGVWGPTESYWHTNERHYYFSNAWGYDIDDTWMHVEDESYEAQRAFLLRS